MALIAYKAETATLNVTDGTKSSTSVTGNGLALTVNAAAANKLAFTTQPGGGTGGTAWTTQPVVTVQDQFGNTMATDTSTVTVAIANNAGPGGVLSGTLTKAAVAGVADFSLNASKLSIDKIGTGYTLTATDSTLASATSNPFNVTLGAAAKLGFTTQPADTIAGVTMASVVVQIQDAGGNAVSQSGTAITLTLNGGTLYSGTNPQTTDVNGKATFGDLVIRQAATGLTFGAAGGSFSGRAIHSTSRQTQRCNWHTRRCQARGRRRWPLA